MFVRPRGSDQFYDALGQRSHYRHSHSTADLIFTSKTDDGVEAHIYFGGYLCANDLDFLTEIVIRLVVNATANIEAIAWHGRLDAPRWRRFCAPECSKSPVLRAF